MKPAGSQQTFIEVVRLKMTTDPTNCIFCGASGKLTKEHIWSRWTHKYIPRQTKHYVSLKATSHPNQTDFKSFRRPGDIIDWKVKCVCEKACNNGWMRNQIEEPAIPVMRPLIEGLSHRITPDAQATIASWATLKAMVAEFDQGAQRVTHYMQRRYFMKHHRPPSDGWAVWIGHHIRGPRGKFHWGSFPALILPEEVVRQRKSKTATYYNSASTSQLIGQLFIQVMRSPHRKLISNWRFTTPDGGTLFRIWPPSQTSVLWPSKSLSANDVDYAIGALKDWLENTAKA
jgi:hypothetical protein